MDVRNILETSEPRPTQNRRPEPPKHTKDPNFGVFNRLFLGKFFITIKGPFHILQQTGVLKSPKGPPFTILQTLRFRSLRYSADFGGSWLVIHFQFYPFYFYPYSNFIPF